MYIAKTLGVANIHDLRLWQPYTVVASYPFFLDNRVLPMRLIPAITGTACHKFHIDIVRGEKIKYKLTLMLIVSILIGPKRFFFRLPTNISDASFVHITVKE